MSPVSRPFPWNITQICWNASLTSVFAFTAVPKIIWTQDIQKFSPSDSYWTQVFFPSILTHPGRPFDLAVFEDRLWISDHEHQQLRSVHKRTGKNLQRIHGNMVHPASIVVVHPLAKPGTQRQQGFTLEINLFWNYTLGFKNITCSSASTSNYKMISSWKIVQV